MFAGSGESFDSDSESVLPDKTLTHVLHLSGLNCEMVRFVDHSATVPRTRRNATLVESAIHTLSESARRVQSGCRALGLHFSLIQSLMEQRLR